MQILLAAHSLIERVKGLLTYREYELKTFGARLCFIGTAFGTFPLLATAEAFELAETTTFALVRRVDVGVGSDMGLDCTQVGLVVAVVDADFVEIHCFDFLQLL